MKTDSPEHGLIPASLIIHESQRIGDALMTLPMAGWIKYHAPQTRVIGLGRAYTEPLWRACPHIDELILLEDLDATPARAPAVLARHGAEAIVHVRDVQRVARWARKAGIRKRVGSARRLSNWSTCNVRPWLQRKRSGLHTAVLNARMLEPFGVSPPRDPMALAAYMRLEAPPASAQARSLLAPAKRNLILHPGTGGGGPPWGLENHAALIRSLDPARWHCIVTGTAEEARAYREVLPMGQPNVADAGGRFGLAELMGLIAAADALVAASTGPLHLGAAFGLRAIGLFSSREHAAPLRWRPLGPDAHALVHDPECPGCKRSFDCDCVRSIPPERVIALLER